MIKHAASIAALAFALLATPSTAQPAGSSEALEQRFDALINPLEQLQWLQQMSSEPNQVGSPHDKANDYSAFLQHLGIASLNLGFGGQEFAGRSYHSIYDTFYHVTHFDDPGLHYGTALSKVAGRLVLRAADGERVPAHYSDFAKTVSMYLDEVMKLAASQRDEDRALGDLRSESDFKLAAAPYDPLVAPADCGITPLIDMLPLQNAVDHLKRAASDADAMLGREQTLAPAAQARSNAALANIDQLLLDLQGLPGRLWYKNLVYAPGTHTGSGAKTLPGVREAIEQRRWDDARTYVVRTAKVLEDYASRFDEATAMARSPS